MKNHHSNFQSKIFLEVCLQWSSREFPIYFGFWFWNMNYRKFLRIKNMFKIPKVPLSNHPKSFLDVGWIYHFTPTITVKLRRKTNSQTDAIDLLFPNQQTVMLFRGLGQRLVGNLALPHLCLNTPSIEGPSTRILAVDCLSVLGWFKIAFVTRQGSSSRTLGSSIRMFTQTFTTWIFLYTILWLPI